MLFCGFEFVNHTGWLFRILVVDVNVARVVLRDRSINNLLELASPLPRDHRVIEVLVEKLILLQCEHNYFGIELLEIRAASHCFRVADWRREFRSLRRHLADVLPPSLVGSLVRSLSPTARDWGGWGALSSRRMSVRVRC